MPEITDSQGRRLDARAHALIAGSPVDYLPSVGQVSGEKPAAPPTGLAVARAASQLTVSFTPAAKASSYRIQVWKTATPAAVSTFVTLASPLLVLGTDDASGYSVRVLSCVSTVDATDPFSQSDWCTTVVVA